MIGHTLGQYRIIDRLGEGGMGEVYRAVDEMIDREVALKMLRAELAHRTDVVDRFRAEAVTLARLDHPRIARLHGLTRHEASMFMVMEFVPGKTLQELAQQSGPMPWRDAVAVVTELLDGLEYAHDAGVVHRDIKPANIMVRPDGHVKVTDFGIARVLGTTRATQMGHIVGTMEYMAPEQIRGEEVDGRADLYAVGIVLYELLTGRVPFTATTEYELMRQHLEAPVTSIQPLAGDVPAWFDDVIRKALAKAPADRFASAEAFRAELLRLAASEPAPPLKSTRLATIVAAAIAATPAPPTRLASIANDATRLAASSPDLAATRLAPASAAPPTRLAAASTPGRANAPAPARLTWQHGVAAAAIIIVLVGVPVMWRVVFPKAVPSAPITTSTDDLGSTGSASQPPVATAPPPVEIAPPPIAPTPAPESPHAPRKAAAPAHPADPPAQTPAPAAPAPVNPPVVSAPTTGPTTPVPSVPPPDAQPPASSARTSAPTRAPLATLQFEKAALLLSTGLRDREQDAVLRLEDTQLVVRDAKSMQVLQTIPYAKIQSATYSETEIKLVVTKSVKHWLTIRTGAQPVVVRMDKTNFETIIAEFEARSGLTVRGK